MVFRARTPAHTQADRAYEVLLRRLILLDYAPGELLNESQMCEELGLGRTPIREALKRLEGDGLVAFYPRRGTFATHVDITELTALYEYRTHLEPVAARLAAQNLDAESRAQFEGLLQELLNADSLSPRELLELDARVHSAVFHATGNPYLERDLVRIDNLATRIWSMVSERIPDMGDHVREHIEIVECVLAGDGERAAMLAQAHSSEFEETVRRAL